MSPDPDELNVATANAPARSGPLPGTSVDRESLLEFMIRLGQAFLACGETVSQVALLLRRVAAAYGEAHTRILVFPTAIFITLGEGALARTTMAEGPGQVLRLDQIAGVYALGQDARDAAVSPRVGLDRLAAILSTKARFGPAGIIIGHAILTVGLAMVLMPSFQDLGAAALLGLIVGSLKVFNGDRPVLAVPLSVVAATIVSALVFLAIKHGLRVDALHVLVSPLVTFLPGAALTLSMVELAYGDMVSGSSRLISGMIQLVLLAFGLAAGAAMVGVSSSDLLNAAVAPAVVVWEPWVAVLIFGTGVYLHFSAPARSLPWMLLVLLIAFAAQRVGAGLLSNEISGFFGMLVATPLGYLIQLRFRGPPAMVTFLPSFWLLVPGSLGLLSVTRMLTDRVAGLNELITAVFAMASIALGALVGASIYKWLTETFNWWGLQLGRARSFLQQVRKR